MPSVGGLRRHGEKELSPQAGCAQSRKKRQPWKMKGKEGSQQSSCVDEAVTSEHITSQRVPGWKKMQFCIAEGLSQIVCMFQGQLLLQLVFEVHFQVYSSE